MAKKKSNKKVNRPTPTKKVKPGKRVAALAKKKKASRGRAVAAGDNSKKKPIPSNQKTKSASRRKTKTTAKPAGRSAPRAAASQSSAARTVSRKTSSTGTGKAKKLPRASAKRPGKTANKESLPPATAQDPIQFPEETRRVPKTKLTRKELNEFRKLLLIKRAELTGDVVNMSSQVNNRNGIGGDHGTMPIHMADIGSDNWEHEFTLGLLANEHERIREIDNALLRIKNRTYGICLATHNPISKARLTAKPWAKYCIAYARAREQGRAS